jgi:hypothetical protein
MVTWKTPTSSYGRNRTIKTTGIVVQAMQKDVTLYPVTSRGSISHNAYLELPADPAVLRALAKELTDTAAEVEARK